METDRRRITLWKPWTKNYGVSLFQATEEDRKIFMRLLSTEFIKYSAHAFFQSGAYEGDYLFMEFWTEDQNIILQAAELFAEAVNLPLEFD